MTSAASVFKARLQLEERRLGGAHPRLALACPRTRRLLRLPVAAYIQHY